MAYNLNEIQGDFGQGIQIETPALVKDYFNLKIRASQMFLNYDQLGENQWTPFYTTAIGISNAPEQVTKAVALYWEGGVMAIFPDSKFARPNTQWAGYGLFGFNFSFDPSFCYFLEAGGIGSGAIADKSDNKRVYSNGFLIQVGFKIHFVPK